MPKPDIKQIVARNLSALMSERGISNRELAERTGVSETTIGRIRRAENAPAVDTLDAIAKYFQVDTFLFLLEGFDAANPTSTRLMTPREKQLLDALRRFTSDE